MATNNEEYWRQRTQAIVNRIRRREKDVIKELGEIYTEAKETLTKDLQAFYAKYADQNGLSIQEAQKKVARADVKNLYTRISRLLKKKELTDKEIEQFDLLRAKHTVTRLDLLIHQMELELIDIYGDVQITMDEHLKTVAAETYYETSGMVGQFARLPTQEVEQIVNFPWSGSMFSELLWGHKDQLVKSLRKTTTVGLIRGDGIPQMARALREEVGNSRYAAERLIRTETAAVMNQATLKGYKDNGLTRYEISERDDEKTDTICNRMDGKVFKISEAVIGVTTNPFHPNCRGNLLPVID